MQSFSSKVTLALLLLASLTPLARGQVSIDEAERKLREKLATRPSTTKPVTEIDRLRAENRRLREEVASLEQEVVTLKEILAHATSPTTRPVTRPSAPAVADDPVKALVGHWRGGDITAGTGYLIHFDDGGVYTQTFIANTKISKGQFRLNDNTMEMWDEKWPEDKRHNQYQIRVTPAQITLTPIVIDGFEVKTPRPLVLRRAE